MDFVGQYLGEAEQILQQIDRSAVEEVVRHLADTRERGGRVFVLGVGGSAAAASHFVNDLRKLTSIEAYAPTDNVSELTARTNDEGWDTTFSKWLDTSRLSEKDAIFILSVGGGNSEKNVSPNLVQAIDYARDAGATTLGVVGRDGGHTAAAGDASVVIPTANPDHVTPHTEAFHAVICHLIVSHPSLKASAGKWESVAAEANQ